MLVNVGKRIEREIDHTALPQVALDHVIYIGLRNILMDSHASVTADKVNADGVGRSDDGTDREVREQSEAMVDKKLAALMSGEVRMQSTREGDPVRTEALRMATAQIHATIKKAGKKVADYKSAAIRAKAAERVTPELLALAAERVAQLKSTAAVESLDDLGL